MACHPPSSQIPRLVPLFLGRPSGSKDKGGGKKRLENSPGVVVDDEQGYKVGERATLTGTTSRETSDGCD